MPRLWRIQQRRVCFLVVLLAACSVLRSKLPGVLRSDAPAITTALSDARTEVAFLDGFDATPPGDLSAAPLDQNGAFLVPPGAWRYDAQSYCLHAGKYGPTEGDGYLLAPLAGPRADVIHNILVRSVSHTEVDQQAIQVLIWGVLSHAKITDMSEEARAAARVLLTDTEIFELSAGALGDIEPAVEERLLSSLPPLVRQTVEAEDRIRELFQRGQASYEDLRRVAVLAGVAPPGPGSRSVPGGRWSYHPGGYFVRYQPTGYPHTLVDVYVPERIAIVRDRVGRIVRVADSNGNQITVDYDAIPATVVPGDASVQLWAFRRARVIRRHVAPPAHAFDVTTAVPAGYVLVGVPAGRGAGIAGTRVLPDLPVRYAAAARAADDARRVVAKSAADVVNLVSVAAAIGPDGADLALRAAASSLCIARGDCRPDNGLALRAEPPLFAAVRGGSGGDAGAEVSPLTPVAPAGDVATPANTSNQRLAQSARPDKEKQKDRQCDQVQQQIDEAGKLRDAYRNACKKGRPKDYDDLNDRAAKEVFGENARSGDDYVSPMRTDPETCEIIPVCNRRCYWSRKWTDLDYDADHAHEETHARHCSERNKARDDWDKKHSTGKTPPQKYKDWMKDPCNAAKDEGDAYQAKIDKLEAWKAQNCH